jgi:hypothetical protein
MDRDRAFFHASAAPSRTRRRSTDAGVLIGLFACVIGMLLFDGGVSKRPHWYEPRPINHVSRSEAEPTLLFSQLRLRPLR